MSTTNYAIDLANRPYHTDKSAGEPPFEFEPTPPDHPGSPAAVVYPGTLNSAERAEVERYLTHPIDAVLATLTLPDSIAKALEYKTYLADPIIKAYRFAIVMARRAQFKIAAADSLINNLGAIPPLGDPSGSGGGTPPDPFIPPGHDVP
jgi:hypothetical protein